MWIFNFEKDADGKHPYTPLQALDNLTEEEIFNKEERICIDYSGFGKIIDRKGLLLVTNEPVGLSTNLFVGRLVINRLIGDYNE
jgi:hypothetical protein